MKQPMVNNTNIPPAVITATNQFSNTNPLSESAIKTPELLEPMLERERSKLDVAEPDIADDDCFATEQSSPSQPLAQSHVGGVQLPWLEQ